MTELGFTAADNNSALEKKFFGLQQYIATFEGEFKKGLLRRWEIILNKFNKDKGKTYDFRDVEVRLQRNIPSDETTMTTNALKLRGLLSDETVINLLPQDLDAQSEMAKMDLQNEENIQKNLENMKQLGNEQYKAKEGGEDDMGLPQQADAKTEKDISKDKQTDTKQVARDI